MEKNGNRLVTKRYIEAIDALIFTGSVKNYTDFARKIGVHQANISNIKNSEDKNVSISLIEKTVGLFPQININYIFSGKGKPLNSDKFGASSKDNGAFGSEVEKQLGRANKLEKELDELKKDFKAKEEKYLEIIRNLSLGKIEVIDHTAGECQDQPPIRRTPESMTKQLEEAA